MKKMNITKGEKIFWNLFENSAVGMSITTIDGHLHANEAFCRLLGYQQKELIDLNWADLTHPDDILFNKIVTDNILAGKKQSDRWEKRYIHKNGSIIWVDIHTLLYRDEEGKPLHFVTTINDISSRKAYEVALSNSEERFRTLIRQMNEGIAIVDPDGNFLFGNPAIEKILYLKEDSVKSKNFRLLLGDKLLQKIQSGISDINSGELFQFECNYTLSTGEQRLLAGCASARESTEIFILLRDVTEQKKAEEEIKFQNEQLKISHAEKDKFFAILAHDLRSPLSSFLGLTEVMAEDINDMSMSEIEDISKSLYLSATNLFQLLENLLEWSIIKGGNSVYIPENNSLKRLINKSIEPLLESARKKSIEVYIEIQQSYQVYCDLRMTETIMRNLVSNAIKFTNKGGEIRIMAKRIHEDKIDLSVADNGIGMSQEMVDNLFRNSDQFKRKGTEGEISSGLGLMICREFAEKQGGILWTESEENKGSVFHFTLQLTTPPS